MDVIGPDRIVISPSDAGYVAGWSMIADDEEPVAGEVAYVRADLHRGAVDLADAVEVFLRDMDALENPRPASSWFALKDALHAFRGGQSPGSDWINGGLASPSSRASSGTEPNNKES